MTNARPVSWIVSAWLLSTACEHRPVAPASNNGNPSAGAHTDTGHLAATENERRLIRLSETGRFSELDFDKLSEPERVFQAIYELEADVNNGGFHQYFFNSSGDTAFAVEEALTAIGAQATAKLVAQAKSIFPGSAPPRDRSRRQALLQAISTTQNALLDRLDREFYKYPDDLTQLVYAYVARHATDIRGTIAAGIAPE
jgi:hypothetical protein